LTDIRTYGTSGRMARPKLFPIRITLPLTTEMVKRTDAALEAEEDRVELIRKAIDSELKRRERRKP
jgi:metal-responsive CopG/Arc/MetJ family transcriptional regulator